MVELGAVVRHIRTLVAPQDTRGLTDRQLLDQFATRNDQAAFAVLLRRHGPLVLGVCRHLLRHEQDAEDAFQATFLILARKAGSIRKGEALAGWLHGVAYRTAMKAKRDAARRRTHEARARTAMRQNNPSWDAAWHEVQAALDEEVQRLPEKYRSVFVLCCLEGYGRAEAAHQLGLKDGTVRSRLAEARKQLQRRLARRGITLSALLGAAALAPCGSRAGVPSVLADATVRAAQSFAAGRAADVGAVSARVIALVEGVTRSMCLTNKTAAVLVLAAVLAASAGLVAQTLTPQEPLQGQEPATSQAAADTPDRSQPEADRPRTDANGDPVPPGAVARLGTVRLRHGDRLGQVQFAADGKTLLTAGRDGTVRVWDPTTGRELRRLGHEIQSDLRPGCRTYLFGGLRSEAMFGGYARTGVVFSADGRSAALAELDGSVSLWDVASGKERCRLDGTQKQGGVFGLGLSADGALLVSRGKDETLVLWDAGTGKKVRQLPTEPASKARMGVYFGIGGDKVENYVFSPDGKLLATLDVDTNHNVVLQVWDVAAARELWRVSDTSGSPLNPPTFSAGGKTLVRLAADKAVKVHDAVSGKELRRVDDVRAELFPTWTALAPDGRRFAVQTAEGVVLLYDLEAGKIVRELGKKGVPRFASGSCTAIAFSPDGKTLAQGVDLNSVRLWDLATGKAREWADAGHRGPITALGVSADGKTVTTVAPATVHVWDVAAGKELRRVPVADDGVSIALSADGRLLAVCAADGLHVRETAGAGEVRHLRPADKPAGHHVYSARFSADGRSVALASASFQQRSSWLLHVWDRTTGKERRVISGETWVGNAPPEFDRYLADYALSPDGTLLLTLANEPAGPPPGGGLATTFLMRLTDVDSGRELWSVEGEEPFRAGAFAPDGRTVAAATKERLVIYEVASGKERVRFNTSVWKVALSPDGRVLASAEDNVVRLWDVRRGEPIGRLAGHQAAVDDLAFTPDGLALVTGSADSTALVWDVARVVPRPKPAELDAKQLEALGDDLASADAGKAFQAVVGLEAAPGQAVPWLAARLEPVAAPDAQRIARLIAELDSDNFAVREAARKDLEQLGDVIGPALRKALDGSPSPEARRRMEQLLEKTLRADSSGAALRAVRAVEVLEHIATPEARQLLRKLAGGTPEARLTREARAALGRLNERPAEK